MFAGEKIKSVFQCQQCGECCQGRGGILPTAVELDLIAQYLKMPVPQLEKNFLELTPLGLAVKNKAGGACIFNEQGRCSIHPVKPRICRHWPFLPAILLHENEFEAAKEGCPGLNPDGCHQDFLKWWLEETI
jgi:Fe-S-cluster containining protein